MANYPVSSGTTLDRFLLREVKVQQWRIPYLIRCNGVRVYRNQAWIQLNGPQTRLQDRDYVQLDDPLTDACKRALAAIPAADFRDYAFVPGTSSFELEMQGVMDHRPQTIRIQDPLVDNLAGFIAALANSTSITNPIRHLIVGSHASPEGDLFIPMTIASPTIITYEDLEAAEKSRSLVIDARLLQPRPVGGSGTAGGTAAGTLIAPALLIRGCRIGNTLPFLNKLKDALGRTVTVIAPKHFHIAAHQARPPAAAEYMGYSFAINRATAFGTKAEAVAAFTRRGFTRIDGSPVPARSWNDWIPDRTFNNAGDQNLRAAVIIPATRSPDTIPARWRHRPRTFLATGGSVHLQQDPGTEAGRKKAVRDDLVNNLPRYQASHPFPEYVRWGYTTMDEFMNGWTWAFNFDSSTKLLHYNATRHEYVVIRPIVDPANNNVFMNYYPIGGTGQILEQLDPSDTRFFASV
jgi:hypothetical protein